MGRSQEMTLDGAIEHQCGYLCVGRPYISRGWHQGHRRVIVSGCLSTSPRQLLSGVVAVSGTTTTQVFDVGPVIAAMVVGFTGGVGRVLSTAYFATYNTIAPSRSPRGKDVAPGVTINPADIGWVDRSGAGQRRCRSSGPGWRRRLHARRRGALARCRARLLHVPPVHHRRRRRH